MPGEIQVFYSESYEEANLKEHFHNYYEIVLIKEGCADFKIGTKTYSLSNNMLIFISNLESHEVTVKTFPYKRFFILIDPNCFQKDFADPVLQSIFKQRPEGFQHFVKIDEKTSIEAEKMLTIMQSEYSNNNIFGQEVLNVYLILLLINLYRDQPNIFPMTNAGKSAALISEIQKYVEINCTQDISLKKVSKIFYTDMYYLSHLFKKYSGFNFRQYLILQRISKAKELLLFTDENITNVSHSSGFNNVNHFIRIFKKSENITPYRYRKKFRANTQ